jgi:nucleotide-binding universal stress UspA family protein
MKILTPIDFSEYSNIALEYGVYLSKELNAELHLIHVVKITNSAQASLFKSNKLIEVLDEDAEFDLNKTKTEIASKFSFSNIKTAIVKNQYIAESIEHYVNNHNIDLVIMGTHGSSGIESIIMGQVTKQYLDISSVPVIAIPPSYHFKKISSIVYASDLADIKNEMKPIVPLAELLNAQIHVLNIIPNGQSKETRKKEWMHFMETKNYHIACQFHFVNNENIINGIKDFISLNPTDLLVMYTHSLTLYEKIFFEGLTRQALTEKRVPILIFKQS